MLPTRVVALAVLVNCSTGESGSGTIKFESGRQYEVLSVLRSGVKNVSPQFGTLLSNNLVSAYITAVRDSGDLAREADELLPAGASFAIRTGDSLLVIQQSRFFLSRWIDVAVNHDARYVRGPSGAFVRAGRLWPPWATCYLTGHPPAK